MLSPDELSREAAAAGFQAEVLEKASRLLELLETIRSHPYLKGRIALKGGTALNLFVLKLPRLSVDIDLNYIGAADRETMLSERPKVEQAVQAVCGRLAIQVRRAPSEHAGGTWRLTYTNVWGRPGTLELDINFLLRTPLWPPVTADSHPVGSSRAKGVPLLDVHELAAGKLAALLDRSAPRDLFDASCLLRDVQLDKARLRLALVVYGGTSRRDWRSISVDDVRADSRDVAQQLLPMLHRELIPKRADVKLWSESMASECRARLSDILPLRGREMEFFTALNDRGEILPELITDDSLMQVIVRSHPGLLWKAQNVREFAARRGLRPNRKE